MAGDLFIQTLGHPELRRCDGTPVRGLRRKDLALLAYLCVEGCRTHARGRLATLLWGESPEDRARHSLTQALGRIQKAVERDALVVEKDSVRWMNQVPSDAGVLLAGDPDHPRVDDALTLYGGHFLEGFDPGPGAEEFEMWAMHPRTKLRNAAVRLLELRGARAEAAGEWERALHLGERAVQIEPVMEGGHRRMMRALIARGEQNRALRHYRAFVAWLAEEVGGEPDPETRELAESLRPDDDERPAPPAPAEPPHGPCVTATSAFTPPPGEPEPGPESECESDSPEPASSGRGGEGGWRTEGAGEGEDPKGAADVVDTEGEEEARAEDEACVPRISPLRDRPRRRQRKRWPTFVLTIAVSLFSSSEPARRRRRRFFFTAALAVVLVSSTILLAQELFSRDEPDAPAPRQGEVLREKGRDGGALLLIGDSLYEVPDSATLRRCVGAWPQRIRAVERLPAAPRLRMASVLDHPWVGGAAPVVGDGPDGRTPFVGVGCVLVPIPGPDVFERIFGHRDWSRSVPAPDPVLRSLPRARRDAGAFPLRPVGTLIRGRGDSLRWVVYHGGALRVPGDSVLSTYCRSADDAVEVPDDEFRYYRASADLPTADPPCRRPAG